MTPTPFELEVVAILKASPSRSAHGHEIRATLIRRGFGKHPAAIAMNLTRIAWRNRFFTTFTDSNDARIFVLTSDGAHL